MEEKLITAIIALILAVAAWLKSHSEVENVKKDRELTKADRDTKIALLEQKCEMLESRLNDGNSRFDSLDTEMKSMNEKFDGKMGSMNEKLVAVCTKLDVLIGIKNKSHTPEERPL
jgi:predicted nuclease with TOPRIM domain